MKKKPKLDKNIKMTTYIKRIKTVKIELIINKTGNSYLIIWKKGDIQPHMIEIQTKDIDKTAKALGLQPTIYATT